MGDGGGEGGGDGGGEGGGGDGGGEGGGGEGGGGDGAVNTRVDVPTPLTSVICTPRLAESVPASPCSSDSDDCAALSDGTMMVTSRTILPAMTWTVMSLMFTPSSRARLARKLYATSPVNSERLAAMEKVALTTSLLDEPPGGAGGGR